MNKHASTIAAVYPEMSLLHVLKVAMQLHQLTPVAPGAASKDTVQVMPDIAMSKTKIYSTWRDKVEQMSVVLPGIPKAALNDMVSTESGDLNSIVSKVPKILMHRRAQSKPSQ